MDGKDVKELAVLEADSIGGLAVDFTTLEIYWTDGKSNDIKFCDLDGNNQGSLGFSIRSGGAIAVLDHVAYWTENDWEKGNHSLVRAALGGNGSVELVRHDFAASNLEIIARTTSEVDLAVNPFHSNPCSQSQICLRSSQKSYTCLCSDDYVLHEDNRTCKG